MNDKKQVIGKVRFLPEITCEATPEALQAMSDWFQLALMAAQNGKIDTLLEAFREQKANVFFYGRPPCTCPSWALTRNEHVQPCARAKVA